MRSDRFTIRIDHDFEAIIEGCAGADEQRPSTWINRRIRHLYGELFDLGFVHTVEAYGRDGSLAGGLYGVKIGAAFFGESMFHRATDASKVACSSISSPGSGPAAFVLLDTQFVTDHLASLGAIEVPRLTYHRMLDAALGGVADFCALPTDAAISGSQALALLGCRGDPARR